MRAVLDPARDGLTRRIKPKEQRLVQQSIAHLSIKRFTNPALDRFAQVYKMPGAAAFDDPLDHRAQDELFSMIADVRASSPCLAIIAVSPGLLRKRQAESRMASAKRLRFVEEVYNCQRLHSALGYLSPEEFEDINLPGGAKK